MLGAGAEDEQLPPDDDDFDPFAFHFHGFGQLGQGPQSSPEADAPDEPNPEYLAAMGWGLWPQPVVQPPQQEEAPTLIPLNQINVNPVPIQPTPEQILPALDEVIQAQGPSAVAPTQVAHDDVLAMDDLTDQSEEELQMPPLIDDLAVEMVAFPNLQNLQPLQVEEVPLEDLVDFDVLAPQAPLRRSTNSI